MTRQVICLSLSICKIQGEWDIVGFQKELLETMLPYLNERDNILNYLHELFKNCPRSSAALLLKASTSNQIVVDQIRVLEKLKKDKTH